MSKRVLILVSVACTAALGLAGCGGQQQEGSGESGGEAATTVSGERETVERTGASEHTFREGPGGATARAGSSANPGSSPDAAGSSGVGSATLRVGGEPGLGFSGRCVVDGEEREIGGEAPQTYSYEPDERLECEITSQDRGPLRVTFSDGGGANTTQQVGPGPATLELTYTGDGLSVSTRSSSGTGSQSSSQSSSSSISSSQSSSSVTRSGSE